MLHLRESRLGWIWFFSAMRKSELVSILSDTWGVKNSIRQRYTAAPLIKLVTREAKYCVKLFSGYWKIQVR